jgi:hypothetical protein
MPHYVVSRLIAPYGLLDMHIVHGLKERLWCTDAYILLNLKCTHGFGTSSQMCISFIFYLY